MIPLGKISRVLTRLGELEWALNYVVIKLPIPSVFPILLGRPWLYKAGVSEDWKKKEFRIGTIRIPWGVSQEESTATPPEYTSGGEDLTDDKNFSECWIVVNALKTVTEEDFGFYRPEESYVIIEELDPETNPDHNPEDNPENDGEAKDWVEVTASPDKPDQTEEMKKNDHALGELDVPFSSDWVQAKLKEDPGMEEYYPEFSRSKEESPSPIVQAPQYEKWSLTPEMEWYMGRTIQDVEREAYEQLLLDYKDVFAWSHSDLTGIAPKYGQHRIDLKDDVSPIRQRQYRLNPKYSLKVKEELEKLLETGFIYPINHSEWVSPIVIVPKKVGADGVAKIRVCQDYRKLNDATKKDFYPLPFTDIILDHAAGHEIYTFLDGMSGYYQVYIKKENQVYTTFTTDWGTYAFERMPFGLCNAPGTFQ